MSIKDNPGITTMPRTKRGWAKFINELAGFISGTSGSGSGDFVTLDTSQTIVGLKTFTKVPFVNTNPVWNNANVGTQINSLTADLAPSLTADYVVTYDSSDDEAKRVLLGEVGSSLDDIEELDFFVN